MDTIRGTGRTVVYLPPLLTFMPFQFALPHVCSFLPSVLSPFCLPSPLSSLFGRGLRGPGSSSGCCSSSGRSRRGKRDPAAEATAAAQQQEREAPQVSS